MAFIRLTFINGSASSGLADLHVASPSEQWVELHNVPPGTGAIANDNWGNVSQIHGDEHPKGNPTRIVLAGPPPRTLTLKGPGIIAPNGATITEAVMTIDDQDNAVVHAYIDDGQGQVTVATQPLT